MLLAAVLVLCTCLSAGAYSDDEKNTADALYQMGLFKGYGESYGLDNSLNRYEGYVLMIRLLGEEAAAEKCNASVPFTDVDAAWAKSYVAYAYTTGLTKGVDATHFGGTQQMNTKQLATICLRSLGYDDGANGEFSYEQAETFARDRGIEVPTDGRLDRGASVDMLWDTLNTTKKGSTDTLAKELIGKGVFTSEEFTNAERIEREGISAGDKTGEKGTEIPVEEKPGEDAGKTPGSQSGWGGGGGAPAAHTHQWDSGKVTKKATCTESGVRTYTCAGCKQTMQETIPAKGHVLAADAAVAASCVAAGKTAGTHCSVCGAVITAQNAVPKLEHNYQGGVCIHCGAKDPNAVMVCTHAHETQKITKAVTCETNGVCTHTCTDCKATWTTEIPALGHTPAEDKAVTATCEKDGKTAGSHCSVCGKILLTQQTVKALGHTVAEDLSIAATCEKDGKTAGSHCLVCGKILVAQQTVKALGHTIVKDPSVAATCEKDGKTAGTHCSVCGKILVAQTKIPALGHSIVIDPAVSATRTTPGVTEGSHCSVCGKILVAQKTIPAIGGYELPPIPIG